jgi:hypothetical protein
VFIQAQRTNQSQNQLVLTGTQLLDYGECETETLVFVRKGPSQDMSHLIMKVLHAATRKFLTG